MTIKGRFQRLDGQKLILGGIIIAIVVFLSIVSPKFFTIRNFTNVLLQVAVIVIIASAANLLMITGNFDLSVGSVLAFCAILHAYMSKHGIPIPISILICCAAAIVWGGLNGLMVGALNITPVIATMATMYSARGFAFLIARWDGGANISAGLPPNFSDFGRTMVFGRIPIVIIFMVLALAIFIFIEKKTVLGRFSYAIGGNRRASSLSGINVAGVVTVLYMLVGLLAGLCGVIQVSRVGSAFPNIGEGMEFDVVVAIVLGGTSMLGGEGSIFGMILGALIVGLTANGMNLFNVPYFYQTIAYGIIVIGSVFVDQMVRRKSLKV